MVEPIVNIGGVAPEAASMSTAIAPANQMQSQGQQAALDDDDAVVAARHKNLQHPRPRRGWKLVRNVVLPRTDPSNPKSSFGLNLIKSAPQATSPHTVVKEAPPSAAPGNAARKDDIVVAVNGHVVFNVDAMEVCDKYVFRYVIRLMKQTGEGHPLRLDVLRPYSDGDGDTIDVALEGDMAMDGNDSVSTPEISDDSLVAGPAVAVAGPKSGSTGADPMVTENSQNQTTTSSAVEPKTQQHNNKVRSSFIVQVPPATKVGDTIRVRIPSTNGEASPKVVGITCPTWLGYVDTRKRYLRLVLSDEKAPPIEGATPMDYIAASAAARSARHRSSSNFLTLSPSKNRRKRRQFLPSPSIPRYAGSNAKSGGNTKYDEEEEE